MTSLLQSLPDDLPEWRGTAAELAEKCNELLRGVPSLADDAGSANERLVRHYVQLGILSAPEREGREAFFGMRQVIQFLAARYLLKDGWSLAKAAELIKGTDLDGLVELIPSERLPTRAEEAIARYKREHDTPPIEVAAVHDSVPSYEPEADFSLKQEPAPVASARPAIQKMMNLESPLARAASISRRRVSLEENLKSLGNREGRPAYEHTVRIALTPWCHVHVDAGMLESMTDETPEILGAALSQALQEERIQKGKRP